VTDLEYFCNKSWTASFNFNTKSWVSFHTYLPNFYIGENNFFYSGLNEGCDITAIAVTEIPSSTTTTTTTVIYYCNLSGTAVVTGYPCALEGEVQCTEGCPTTTTTSTTTTTTSTTSSTTTAAPIECYLYEVCANDGTANRDAYDFSYTSCVGTIVESSVVNTRCREICAVRDSVSSTSEFVSITEIGLCP
jgi:hypothetical protein